MSAVGFIRSFHFGLEIVTLRAGDGILFR